jgi:hypothetical protein
MEARERRDISQRLFDDRSRLDAISNFLEKNIKVPACQYVYVDRNRFGGAKTAQLIKIFGIRTNLFKDANGKRNTIYFNF